MVYDYWVYQNRKVNEPWAMHVIVGQTPKYPITLYVYAEYFPDGHVVVEGDTLNFACLLECASLMLDEKLALDDIKQLQGLWNRIKKDFNIK